MSNEIYSVRRVEADRFDMAKFDGTNAEWMVRTFFDSNRSYFVDGDGALNFYLRNGLGPCYLPEGEYGLRRVVPEVQWYGPSSGENTDETIIVGEGDLPNPLEDPMS
ncbi:hypothetical protein SEA_WENTWORTH_27 [Streptomyces phage Wentworth]|nr:hypothetical protein SEA_WENTWORTH_27 [Streptomyces phage Wentworth]